MNLSDLEITCSNHGEDGIKVTAYSTRWGWNFPITDIVEAIEKYADEVNLTVEIDYLPDYEIYKHPTYGTWESFEEMIEAITGTDYLPNIYCRGKSKKESDFHSTNVHTIKEVIEHMISYPFEFTFELKSGRELTKEEIYVIEDFQRFVLCQHKLNKIKKG
jgi:hypothetical protein